jgi:MinD superfamily P-loop ATPase
VHLIEDLGEMPIMKQIIILSGKGGTGKTSVAAAFAHLAHDCKLAVEIVLADADVDAANLDLVLRPKRVESHDFTSGLVAVIDSERCQSCGICYDVCRFDAVEETLKGYQIDPIACDGCAACVYQCPEDAIHMEPQIAGCWFRSESRYGTLFHAELYPAQENSGKLVTLVKQTARLCALDHGVPLTLVDGPPGIGCPVIAASAGSDLAVIVTEPTIAGIHDLRRILMTTSHFRIPTLVVINKADIYPQGADEIEVICAELGIEMAGQIPFDPTVAEAMMNSEPVTAYRADAPSSRALAAIWQIVSGSLIIQEGAHA